MAPPITNYVEIQQDEIEALRSIYMEAFEEEKGRVGAWKTLPKLSLTFSEALPSKLRAEAEHVLKTKPTSMLGSEMMFEITTSLQDLLDRATYCTVQDVPALNEERANREAVMLQQAQKEQAEKQKEKHQANIDEEQHLAQMLANHKSRGEKRREKLTSGMSKDSDSGPTLDLVQFDQPANLKDPRGIDAVIEAVFCKMIFQEGPVTRVWLVRHVSATEGSNIPLVLKECHVPTSQSELSLKKQIQGLESKLENLTRLPHHQNVIRPLAFKIERSEASQASQGQGWMISILMEKAGRGSLHDRLETGPLEVALGRAWIIQLLEGLGHYHRNGISHGQIHTRNILLEKIDTGRIIAKLSDGGYLRDLYCLKDAKHVDYTAAASLYWTPPELAQDGSMSVSPATDIWSLAVVILQMFFGLDVQTKYQSPRSFLESTNLSPSFERMLRSMFRFEAREHPSAWDLVASGFLRNDDPIFQEASVGSPISKRLQRGGSSQIHMSSSRFASDFVQEGRLGKGGYGSVVKARNKLESKFYAVKVINKCTEVALDKVLNEVRLLSDLNHPNVVRYYTAWKEVDVSASLDEDHDDSIDESASGSEDSELLDLVFPRSAGGLDFIASNGNETFEDESTEEEVDEAAMSDDGGIVFGEDDAETPDKPQAGHCQTHPQLQVRRASGSQQEAVNHTLYIQMEYCEKQTLRDVINDLKPENIFIDSNSNVRIGDFGLARPGEFLQVSARSIQPNKDSSQGHGQGTFTRSVGTTFYVAPEVKSTAVTQGSYDEKADMFSLGVIFFEMNYRLETGMERVHTLSALCKPQSTLPVAFIKDVDKAKQAEIVLSLVNHNPNLRPSSTDLLRSGLVPVQTEDEMVRAALRAMSAPKSEFRLELINKVMSDASARKSSTGSVDTATLLKEYMYDFHGWATPGVSELLLQKDVKDHLASIFRRHGALEVDRPVLFPLSPHYSQHANSVYKLIDVDGTVLQLPLDLTLPNARMLAKYLSPGPKTYTFGDVYRAVPSGGHPRVVGEVDFDIISYNSLDLALREAEAIKVLDEIVDEFPNMATVPMCYHLNHSRILDAVLDACDVPPPKRSAVKEVISRLHTGEHTWATIRSELRNPPVSVPATSIEELISYDFRDACENAFTKLRSKLKVTADVELTFSHLKAVATYIERLNVKRKVYINPLGSYNEKFYRGNILFQCVHDSKKKNVFAAGGRYDALIKEHQLIQNPNTISTQRGSGLRGNNAKLVSCYAVGFNLSWQDLHRSVVRYYQGSTKRTSKAKKDQEQNTSWPQVRRCDVLVDSFEKDLLRTVGLTLIQELWKLGVSAELAMGDESSQEHEKSNAYTLGQDLPPYLYLIQVKQEATVKIRNVVQNEETEMRTSEVAAWFKNLMAHRERSEDHGRKLLRYHSQPEQGAPSLEAGADVQVLMAQTKGKKTNRRAIIEEGK
ncbi:MAG: hypothetical protein Q9184_000188 [Pyrenodesmia sp. 2 TL-2023]